MTRQPVDGATTVQLLQEGGREQNPAMTTIVRSPAAFIAVKAASTAGAIFVSERLRRDHPVASRLLMAGVDSLMTAVVAHNLAATR